MIASPDWQGEKPGYIDRVIQSESNIAYALYRTQLFDEQLLAKVKTIQQDYTVQSLSQYEHSSAPASAPKVDWHCEGRQHE